MNLLENLVSLVNMVSHIEIGKYIKVQSYDKYEIFQNVRHKSRNSKCYIYQLSYKIKTKQNMLLNHCIEAKHLRNNTLYISISNFLKLFLIIIFFKSLFWKKMEDESRIKNELNQDLICSSCTVYALLHPDRFINAKVTTWIKSHTHFVKFKF